jgi:hypothetical protein
VSSKANHTTSSANPRKTRAKTNGVSSTARNGESQLPSLGVSIDKDFCAWLLEQGRAMREHRLESLDWENIAEELEGMARSQKHALTSHLRVMLAHLLKWAYQARGRERHLRSWQTSIVNSRIEIRDALEDSPSLGNEGTLGQLVEKAYSNARRLAAAEMGLSDREMDRLFPAECPWTVEQFMAEGFLPEPQSAATSR